MAKKATIIGGVSATAIALAIPLIAYYEGSVLRPYRDPVGILTVCYGHTGKDIEQRRYTRAECAALLARDTKAHAATLACIKKPLEDYQQAAFISFAYNIGAANFCASTLVKKANAGDMAGACAELSRWTRAGGKVLSGLVKRRAAERAICEGDATAGGIIKDAPAVVLQGSAQDIAHAICEGEIDATASTACEQAIVTHLTAEKNAGN